jgi:hypothetical protein
VNAWLESQKVRVLIPLVGASLFALGTLGSLMAVGIGASHHVFWRELIFGTCLLTLGTVTGIKGRHT